jgi:broad specificity phosphatase PhoE
MATSTEIKKSFPDTEIIIEPLLAEYQPYYKHCINLYPDGIPTTYDGIETSFIYPEKYINFNKRVKFIISKLMDKHNDDIIVVTHGEVLKAFISYLQIQYPDLMLDSGSTPYLTVLSFKYVKVTKKIDETSIWIE